jgi:hypothetical protein
MFIVVLLILIAILILVRRPKVYKPRKQRVQQPTPDFYRVPKLNTLPQFYSGVGLNDMETSKRDTPYQQDETNQQASRWAGSIESQSMNNDSDQRVLTNMDVVTDPSTLQSGLKNGNNINTVFGNRLGWATYADIL